LKAIVAVLPGDSGGSEVTAQAARVLEALAKRFGHELQIETALYGALAIDACGDPLPAETLDLAKRADAAAVELSSLRAPVDRSKNSEFFLVELARPDFL